MIKEAMILAAGFGKRVRPLTLNYPKPLLKIGNETLLSNTIKFLSYIGINQIVINVHYLGDQIIEYINKNKFNTNIHIIEEKNEILDTGGGVLNAIKYFSNEPFLIINPDTIWNYDYLNEIKLMEKIFLKNIKNKCTLLIVNKNKSSDKSLNGDFSLDNHLITRKKEETFKYIYTGLQIIKPDAFSDLNKKIFSINKIWDNLIQTNSLYGVESNINFSHISTLTFYNSLNIK